MIELKEKYKFPSEFAEFTGRQYAISTSEKHKKDCGQFFTPKQISDFMGDLAVPKSSKISILDPGCGTAILSCSLIEKLVSKINIEQIDLTLYETDTNLLKETKKVVFFLQEWLHDKGIVVNIIFKENDFIIDNAAVFTKNSLFDLTSHDNFDYIISNPPYFKIQKADTRAGIAKELVYGQPNIYSIFMGLSAKLLKHNGELIFITPRSFAAGNYFKAFRQSFFNAVSISDIHIFESRNKMFKNDNVLQENIILRANKGVNPEIRITSSESDRGLSNPTVSLFKTEELIDISSKDKTLFIPSNHNEASTINVFKRWKNTLSNYNIQISTGPVVAFRSTEFLNSDGPLNESLSPLLWLHNIKEMEFVYPLTKANKPGFIINSENSRRLLLKNKNYVLLRRFSSKDDKSRLVCCPYFSSAFQIEMLGIENHVNYIHRPNGELSEDEVWGVSALFSSSLFDTYFRTFNGNTQVGASELKQIKMPPLEKIILIGSIVKAISSPQKQNIDKIINEVLLEKTDVEIRRSTSDLKRVRIA
ncbi:MAG: Eco57I restriction-modification methylase domain-containing protein [Prolixibacteraceae bacterium]